MIRSLRPPLTGFARLRQAAQDLWDLAAMDEPLLCCTDDRPCLDCSLSAADGAPAPRWG